MEHYAESLNDHCGRGNLGEEILATYGQAGKDVATLERTDFSSCDEFHIRGLEAMKNRPNRRDDRRWPSSRRGALARRPAGQGVDAGRGEPVRGTRLMSTACVGDIEFDALDWIDPPAGPIQPAPGSYALSVQAEGFRATGLPVEVEAGQSRTIEVALQSSK